MALKLLYNPYWCDMKISSNVRVSLGEEFRKFQMNLVQFRAFLH